MRIRLLGPVGLWEESRRLDTGSPKQQAVFAALASHAQQVLTREELIKSVWGIDAPTTAVNSLYTYVARLRNVLEPERSPRGASRMLVSDGSGYSLIIPPEQVDQHLFVSLLKSARHYRAAGEVDKAVSEMEAALDLWEGIPYGGVPGPFASAERARLTEMRLTAIEERAELLLGRGEYNSALGELVSLARAYPLRERMCHLLMLCCVALGRQADALNAYHRLRASLVEEMGIDPGEPLQRLYGQILRQDSSLLRFVSSSLHELPARAC
ncbi:BTAD domain-containing putative transcriptional regulator [Streptomyces sp. NPDC098781]|uniref:AfsR/SARP family transcriptional regulator n=1 Tax=Streptomyces sp. NPDC098781 TaxID=3366097 RepID=UPI00382E4E26